MRLTRTHALKTLSLALSALAVQGAAQAARPDFPGLSLPEAASGQRAIEMLGQHLPAVARWYGKSAEEFVAILRRDATAHIDRNGRLHYIDTHVVEAAPDATGTAAPEAAVIPDEQTFLLHSRPGALRTIYLDFNGHTTTGTAWN
ncbi:MAG: hypothetical protein KDG55_24590, partial [Rhodocyclaceae bacterium]|nr:hypothetical protein [Rhodocyclaceae bacterium]